MTEVAIRQRRADNLPAKVAYAHELANSGLLPAAYRRNPANVLYAVEFGDMLGLAPMAAITGVHVIEGKPTASAGLISALVRRAGHKLRVTGNSQKATCQIIRSDDPDYTFEVTWTLKRNSDGHPSAEEAGLSGKGVWKNYPASMLKSRVITQCARDACEEALFGLHYTPEEMGAEVNEDGEVLGEVVDTPAAQPETDPEWLAGVYQRAATFADEDEGARVWAEIVAKVKAGECTRAEADSIAAAWKGRRDELKAQQDEPLEGEIVPSLDPENPWAAKVEEIATPDDAEAAEAELVGLLKDGQIDPGPGNEIRDAIRAKAATLTAVAA